MMRGKELKYILNRFKIYYKPFAKTCGKAEGTIQRWISNNAIIGEGYVVLLEKAITVKKMQMIREEYHELQLAKSKPKHESSKPNDRK